MRLLTFVLVLVSSGWAQAQPAPQASGGASFTYDDHGRRDPFVPLVSTNGLVTIYDQNLSMNDLDLEGIVADPSGNNVALVNGKIIKIGDAIGPYTVSAIALDHVEFSKGTEKSILRLKKGGM